MKTIVTGAFLTLLVAAVWAQSAGGGQSGEKIEVPPTAAAIEKGAKWLVSVQGADGGWGQDGGETSYVRTGERLESGGNDVANTAVATLALLQAGKKYQPNVDRALDFILKNVETSSADGLQITDRKGTQIQRKLGPYIDTFLTSMLLAQVDGTLSKELNARVRRALEKCVAKIERNQQKDGSWNIAGGWAPILGTSMASRSLFEAAQKGVKIEDIVMRRAEDYTVMALSAPTGVGVGASVGVGAGAGFGGAIVRRISFSGSRRPSLPKSTSSRTIEPNRGRSTEERGRDQKDPGRTWRCEVCGRLWLHRRGRVFLLSQRE